MAVDMEDFDAFMARVNEVDSTIKGLASGDIDPDSIDTTEMKIAKIAADNEVRCRRRRAPASLFRRHPRPPRSAMASRAWGGGGGVAQGTHADNFHWTSMYRLSADERLRPCAQANSVGTVYNVPIGFDQLPVRLEPLGLQLSRAAHCPGQEGEEKEEV